MSKGVYWERGRSVDGKPTLWAIDGKGEVVAAVYLPHGKLTTYRVWDVKAGGEVELPDEEIAKMFAEAQYLLEN